MIFRRLIFISVIFLAFSCVTVITEMPEGLTAEEMFFRVQVQQGQIKTGSDYDAVIKMFRDVIELYPQYRAIAIECRYEIAYLLYRQKKYRESEDAFYEILRFYETNTSDLLPDWPQTLSNQMIEKIEEKTKPKEKTKSSKKR